MLLRLLVDVFIFPYADNDRCGASAAGFTGDIGPDFGIAVKQVDDHGSVGSQALDDEGHQAVRLLRIRFDVLGVFNFAEQSSCVGASLGEHGDDDKIRDVDGDAHGLANFLLHMILMGLSLFR